MKKRSCVREIRNGHKSIRRRMKINIGNNEHTTKKLNENQDIF